VDVLPARDVALDGALVYSWNPGAPDAEWLMRRHLPVVRTCVPELSRHFEDALADLV